MTVRHRAAVRMSSWFPAALLAAAVLPATAAPVSHWSARHLSSNEYIRSAEHDSTDSGSVKDYSGKATEGAAAGSRDLAYSVPGGGFVIRTETSDVQARADLATGELKARAVLGLSGNLAGSTGVTPAFGERATTARAEASFADRFSMVDPAGNPYAWLPGDRFTFSFAADGVVSIPGAYATPLSSSLMNWASLRFNVYHVGGLQAIEDFASFDYFAYAGLHGWDAASAEFARLMNEVDSRKITSTGWCLGDNRTIAGFCGGTGFAQVALAGEPVDLSFEFDPGGDFEWIASLEMDVAMDLFYENQIVGLDFSHTVTAGFVAPEGVQVRSASGLFPGATAPSDTVPEPSTLALLLAAGALLGRQRSRPRSVTAA
ncbi:MAG: hypothetical protein ABS84_05375 [Rubrivivax sp. SCN 71-131]|nr:MAG: hypothetical protein ABS84_05375 [Rubrivivax sp. SCN 71-131]